MDTKDERLQITVPYVAHESGMARMERIIRRLWVVIVLLIVLLVGTNAGWLWYDSQFEDMTITQEATTDAGGDAIATNVVGDYYDKGETNSQNP